MAHVKEQLRDLIIKQVGNANENIDEFTNFIDDLGFDSLDEIEFITACEEYFEIEIPDGDQDSIKTFGEAVQYIEKRLRP